MWGAISSSFPPSLSSGSVVTFHFLLLILSLLSMLLLILNLYILITVSIHLVDLLFLCHFLTQSTSLYIQFLCFLFYAIYITSGSSSSDCFCQTEAFLLIGSNLGYLLAYLCVYIGKFGCIIYEVCPISCFFPFMCVRFQL